MRLLADKAYSHTSTRKLLRTKRIAHTIPERSGQIARRKEKGSRGGRPPVFDAVLYRHRNTVERGFNRLKHWRGVATRYDMYAIIYLGGVLLAPQSQPTDCAISRQNLVLGDATNQRESPAHPCAGIPACRRAGTELGSGGATVRPGEGALGSSSRWRTSAPTAARSTATVAAASN